MMGRFHRSLQVLAGCGIPLFDMMRDTDCALPMARKIRTAVVQQVTACRPELSPKAVDRALGKLSNSRRYLQACVEPGAQRHDLMGRPVEPLSEKAIVNCHRLLADIQRNVDRQRAEGVPT